MIRVSQNWEGGGGVGVPLEGIIGDMYGIYRGYIGGI